MTRDSIVVVTRNFPPLTGGMERLMKHTVEALAVDFDVILIGPSGSRAKCPAAARVIECPATPIVFLFTALMKGLPLCIGSKHRLVFGGSGLVAPITAILGKLCGAKTAILVHGLDLVASSAIYQRLFVPSIRRHDLVVANSKNTRKLAISNGCPSDRIRILHPGAEIPDEDLLRQSDRTKEQLEISNSPVALFVGRIIRRKGLAPFLKKAWPLVLDAVPEAKLLVVGDTPKDALMRDPNEGRDVDAALASGSRGSVRFLGSVDDEQLWRCYAAADTLIFPLLSVPGDVEGFGMVAIEAAACGTPTVAFPVGGVVDAVINGVNGRLVPEADYVSFAKATIAMLHGESPTAAQCRAHAEKFSWDNHRMKLLSIVDTTVAA